MKELTHERDQAALIGQLRVLEKKMGFVMTLVRLALFTIAMVVDASSVSRICLGRHQRACSSRRPLSNCIIIALVFILYR